MGTGKRNTEIKEIESKAARYVCFSKRREGLFKKAQQYHQVSGSHVAVLVFSPCGKPYVHGSPSFDPIVDKFRQSSSTTIKVEECDSLEKLVEMKRKLEEAREKVVHSFVDSVVL